jgi:hypothetical protein
MSLFIFEHKNNKYNTFIACLIRSLFLLLKEEGDFVTALYFQFDQQEFDVRAMEI